jgi:hypothetical protein
MRVKLCARCPYTPRDLAGHYDPEATLHVCAKCNGEQGVLTKHRPREAQRRQECSTVHNMFGMTQQKGAPSVTESLVSSGTTRGELLSVQRSALIATRPARRVTADGYADLKSPDKQLQTELLDFETGRLRKELSVQVPLMEPLCCLLAMPIQAQATGPSSSTAKDAPQGSLDRVVAVGLGSTPILNTVLEV